jgi:MFS family permease
VATLAFGAGLVSFSLSRTLWLSLLILPVVGAGMMVETASTNTILQTIVEERMRGRVMSFYTMAFLGTAPIGSLVAGVLASRIGAGDDSSRRPCLYRRRNLVCDPAPVAA